MEGRKNDANVKRSSKRPGKVRSVGHQSAHPGQSDGRSNVSEISHSATVLGAAKRDRKTKRNLQMVTYSCCLCKNADTEQMVQCDMCDKWFHFDCVGVDQNISDVDWICKDCQSEGGEDEIASEETSSLTSSVRRKLFQLELEKLKDERAIIEKKYETLSQLVLQEASCRSEKSKNSSEMRTKRTLKWVQDQPKPVERMDRWRREFNEDSCAEQDIRCQMEEQNHQEMDMMNMKFQNTSNKKLASVIGAANHENVKENHVFAQPNIHADFYDEPMLTTRQMAARQAISFKGTLPMFDGNPAEWSIFYSNFMESTRRCGYTNQENLIRLQQSLKGKALEAVRSMLLIPNTVPMIIENLKMLFGRPEIIINSLVNKIRNEPPIRMERMETFINFAMLVQNLIATMTAVNLTSHLNNPMLQQELIGKLPAHIKLDWARYSVALNNCSLVDFSDWLYQQARAASRITFDIGMHFSPEIKADSRKETKFHGTHSGTQLFTRGKCYVCSSELHRIAKCPKFIECTKNQRWDVVKQKKLCQYCLSAHFAGKCKFKKICSIDGCQRYHHPLLHNHGYEKPKEEMLANREEFRNSEGHYAHFPNKCSILFRIIPIKLHNKDITVETYAFLDDGSSLTLMEDELAKQLQLDGPATQLHLKWSNEISRKEEYSRVVSCEISGAVNTDRFPLLNIRTVKKLGLPVQSFQFNTNEMQYKYLQGIPLVSYEDASPRILIGLDNWSLCVPLEIREGMRSCPIATKTRIGWVIGGPWEENSTKPLSQRGHTFHIAADSSDDILHQLVKNFSSIEDFGIKIPQNILESSEDSRARLLLKATTKRKGCRFETGLLWRFDDFKLPDSLPMAKNRLLWLERKMSKDQQLAESLKQQMKDYIEKGYIRKLQAENIIQSPRSWYLPIFVVRNPNKPMKMRVVWDAAAKVDGISLNSMLLSGPDQLPSLTYVLYRFRQGQFAITGDIKEMFHQVQVREEDQHSQRFLWRDGETQRTPDTYVMQVMTFGATCSPSSAQFVKNLNAQDFIGKYPRAVQAIQQNHYVDDWLDSFETEDEAIQIAKQVRFVHSQGGFKIRNWLSNSPRILRELGEQAEVTTRNINSEETTGRILGVWWDTSIDKFILKLNHNKLNMDILNGSKCPTKREVLRTLMCIFDPLGLISNLLIYLKILLQDIWRTSIGWDDKIEECHYTKWQKWTEVLWRLENLQISRCYMTSGCSKPHVQLHTFVDASENAYSAVAYFRVETKEAIRIVLVSSKAKVAPQKPVSIPRLELLAAVLGARLSNSILDGHTLKIERKFIWTDSRTVLHWLNSDARKYRQFVALRIGELLETTDLSEWRWIPTKENVADEATKWKEAPQLHTESRWYNGPEFLSQHERHWPANISTPRTDNSEELQRCHVHANMEIDEPITPDITHFSCWKRLVRSQAYLLRAVMNFKSLLRSSQTGKLLGPLEANELQTAEMILYKKAQWDYYQNEIITLSNQPPGKIDTTSQLYKYNPYLENGILRMYGRIDEAEGVMHDTKRPIILPNHHLITKLIIMDYHGTYHHRNLEIVINEIRQKFLIPKLRVTVKRIKNQCQRCKNNEVRPKPPQMAQLPKARLMAFCKPFSYVGVDYFGPIEVVVGRRKEKRWGVLFTCLTIRAIHIEIASSLSTNSCIQCIRNFIFSRGYPIEIYSDNGTNFRGANNELKREMDKIDRNIFIESFSQIQWKFIPPASPHMGGSWERLIRSVKSNLSEILKTRNPTDEVLRSVLKEIEFIVNSRPLTYIPLDSEDDEAFTPNHFLLGSTNGSKPLAELYCDGPSLKNDWKTAQNIAQGFWRRWVKEYLPSITRRTKWFESPPPIEIGNIVIITDPNNPKNLWPKGIVVDVIRGKDGQIRSAVVRTKQGLFTRPAVKLAVLDVSKPTHPHQLTRGENVREDCD